MLLERNHEGLETVKLLVTMAYSESGSCPGTIKVLVMKANSESGSCPETIRLLVTEANNESGSWCPEAVSESGPW